MCPERLQSQKGFGLMAAVFVITVLAAFGVLIARYVSTGTVASAEDYVWAQSLYAADSAARLRMLAEDGGGGLTASSFTPPQVGSCATQEVAPTTQFNTATGTGTVEVRAGAGGVSRTIVVNYRL
ncbi:MAG: hypothetical protein M0017_06635 [Desulfobacteraceae bacterium]|nr:hypothetical protein [Desulfobacteraceae bacterium]